MLPSPRRLTYCPHERAEFFLADTGDAVHSAPIVAFAAEGAFI